METSVDAVVSYVDRAVEQMAAIVTAPAAQITVNRSIGKAAEDGILAQNPGAKPASFNTRLGWRYIDILTTSGDAIDVKLGRTYANPFFKRQVAKDVWLRANGDLKGAIEYRFVRSPVTGRIGPSARAEALLTRNGIIVTRVP